MPGPTATGSVLVLFGQGTVTQDTFDFRRPAFARAYIYSWIRAEIPVWSDEIQRAINDALTSGRICPSYASVNGSRIGGTILRNFVLGPPAGLPLPTVPAGYGTTAIRALDATVYHDAPTLAASTRMLLRVNDGTQRDFLSDILEDPNFCNRSLDLLWCACRSPRSAGSMANAPAVGTAAPKPTRAAKTRKVKKRPAVLRQPARRAKPAKRKPRR